MQSTSVLQQQQIASLAIVICMCCKVLPHWDPKVDARHAKFNWRPPDEPHSPYMPERGTYSSRNNDTLKAQFQDLAAAGVDSAIVSWWQPPTL
eukprot:3172812-Amphidinium_carterae.1